MEYEEKQTAEEKNAEKMQEIHTLAMQQFNAIYTAQRDERKQALADRRFYSIAGAMWEGQLGEQFENKPKFEINKAHLAIIRIFSEYRNNRITVDFVSRDGSNSDQLADACDGLYRADEQDSCAEEAYDNAFEEGVGGGMGAWRLRTAYEDEYDDENEYQRIRIEPIFDADATVFFDANSRRQDKSDAKHCFVLIPMTLEAYKAEYSDDPATWPKDLTSSSEFDWATPDMVYVAEYYVEEVVKETVYIYQDIAGNETRYRKEDFEADETLSDMLAATGSKEVRQKRCKTKKIHKYNLSGASILDDCKYIAGKHIPIVSFYGKRWIVDGIERFMGHVRLVKDASRLKNMQISKLAEISALSSIEKPILTPEQIAGHQLMWTEDQIKNWPYLLVNPVLGLNGEPVPMGPLQYTKVPNIPPAMAALLQLTDQDIQDLLGNQQQADKIVSNISGKAVEMIQNRLDMQTFIYMSNMAKSIKRSGQIWLSMAKDVLVEEGRKLKAIGQQGEVSTIELMRPVMDEKTGKLVKENDISKADFDLTVDVGPSSSSKRAATVRALTGMMSITQDPENAQVLGAMAMLNMEGEGISDVRDYYRKKLVRMGVVKPTEQDLQDMADEAKNQVPSAQDKYLQSAAAQADADAIKARADTVLTVAKAGETKAKTMETLSNIDLAEEQHVIGMMDKLGGEN